MKLKYQDKVTVKDEFFGDFEGELIDFGQRPKDAMNSIPVVNAGMPEYIDMYLVQFERGSTQRWFEADKITKVESN